MKRLYVKALAALYLTRLWVLTVLIVYIASCLVGWLHADELDFLRQATGALAEKFQNKSGIAFIVALFLHNLVATYISMCLVSLWGLVPVVSAMANGLLLGWVVTTALGASLVDAAVILVPHGVFEWPAMMIAWGTGLWRGVGYRFSPEPEAYLQRLKKANLLFFLIVLPLLLLAAIVEGRGHLGFFFSG